MSTLFYFLFIGIMFIFLVIGIYTLVKLLPKLVQFYFRWVAIVLGLVLSVGGAFGLVATAGVSVISVMLGVALVVYGVFGNKGLEAIGKFVRGLLK